MMIERGVQSNWAKKPGVNSDILRLTRPFCESFSCRLKISLSHSEGKFVAISTTQNKRLCLRQKAVLGLERRH